MTLWFCGNGACVGSEAERQKVRDYLRRGIESRVKLAEVTVERGRKDRDVPGWRLQQDEGALAAYRDVLGLLGTALSPRATDHPFLQWAEKPDYKWCMAQVPDGPGFLRICRRTKEEHVGG